MGQYLALPLNIAEINTGYKNYAPGYNLNGKKAIHYGVDWIGRTYANSLKFFASGKGTVMGVNHDANGTVGKWVAVKYADINGYGDLIVRYYHMETVSVSVGQKITLDTILGVYGSTGRYSTGKHIHTEVNKDTKNWQYTPTLSGSDGCGLFPGLTGDADTTINPLLVFKRKISDPENQTCTVDNDGVWCSGITIPGSFR